MANNRNYSKPWMKGAEGGAKKQGAGNLPAENSFLYSVYPDGVGPDSDLIITLERDVVEKNPQVSFDDIAELEEPKKILQEAVLLPILMP